MQAYDAARFDPPAPLALVIVRPEQSGLLIHDVPMLLDTGADVSLLPRSHVALLSPPDAKRYELEAFDGTKSTAPAIAAELQFLGKTFRGQFLLVDNWHGVLGRNVLPITSVRRSVPEMDRAELELRALPLASRSRDSDTQPGRYPCLGLFGVSVDRTAFAGSIEAVARTAATPSAEAGNIM